MFTGYGIARLLMEGAAALLKCLVGGTGRLGYAVRAGGSAFDAPA
jgi:hypothetical protein